MHKALRLSSRCWWCVSLTQLLVLGGAGAVPTMAAEEAWQAPPDLVLWLDAQRLTGAASHGEPPTLTDGDKVANWLDRSSQRRRFQQAVADNQPTLHRCGDHWTVRFDGKNDHLRHELPGTPPWDVATLYLVVAPRDNPGEFRGILAANARDKRDYESGITVDLGPGPTLTFEQLNVEGHGFGGALDLMKESLPLGTLHRIEVAVDPNGKEVRVRVDGKDAGKRPFTPSAIHGEELTLGARFYENGPGPQRVQGYFSGDIAEVMVFGRLLSAEEANQVDQHLATKYEPLTQLLTPLIPDPPPGVAVKAENPPQVQLVVPGFQVQELPVELPNVNNVRYRDDGILVTLGYNGDIHLLRDTNGDGLEDRATVFWKNNGSLRGPLGMVLTPPGYPLGRGAFIPSKGKVSLIVDQDGDDVADKEIVVAQGWPEIFTTVDALGIARDGDGNLYFGLGVADFSNAYQVGEDGIAKYRRNAENGTIQKVSPDFKTRETISTGMRFTVALAFNRAGDLFCSEQEGATWLPNGNPFDELLHIEPGRHYGFPPRHPRHNPDVIDEPSVFDFGPQHQSTCGLIFNDPIQDGAATFGPAAWRGDAILCGESRGKLWRTQLVKSPAGYVAQTQLLAALQMLTVDVGMAPTGDLIVACHSGPPDWGTGPTGIGKLFRVHMSDAETPRPVAVWADSAHEIHVAFDRALDPLVLRHLAEQIRIDFGQHVRAADRFENLVPPYVVVQQQRQVPRYPLQVAGASISPDLRTLLIQTERMSSPVHYAITLPSTRLAPDTQPGTLAQHPTIDLDYSLHGVQVRWEPTVQDDDVRPAIWLPHLDLDVARSFTQGSAEHERFWAMQGPGKLTLDTQLQLHHMLRPSVQPGATLGFEWPSETVTIHLRSTDPFEIQVAPFDSRGPAAPSPPVMTTLKSQVNAQGQQELSFVSSGDATAPVPLQIRLAIASVPQLSISYSTNEDTRERALPLHRFILPWVTANANDEGGIPSRSLPPELAGGNWGRGRRLYQGDVARCSQCHTLQGQGGKIGPDLSNLIHRDYASVLRDVQVPSFAINPDFIGQVLTLQDGRVLTGVLRTEKGELLLGDGLGKFTTLNRTDIESSQPATQSIMPVGLLDKLSPEERRDLFTYLLTPPPQLPLTGPLKAPPVRTQSELHALLAGAPQPALPTRPLRVLLVAGEKDHGPDEHDYPAWQRSWSQLLSADPSLTVDTAWEFPTATQLQAADLTLFFQKGNWNQQRELEVDAYLQRGGGLVYLHWAVNGGDLAQPFSDRIGLASHLSIKFRHGPLTLDLHHQDHPILRNFSRLELYDESYWGLTGDPARVTLLATSREENADHPQLWVYERHQGRVFVSIPGHYSWTFDDPFFRVLLLRGMAWTVREPVDRFNDLVPLGARLAR